MESLVESNYITIQQAVSRFGIHPVRLRQLLLNGEVIGVKEGKYWYVLVDSVRNYMNTRARR